jgi:hypothetical protein
MEYKSLELTPGVTASFQFDLLDEAGLKIDTIFYTYKLEIFDNLDKDRLVLIKTTPTYSALGSVTFEISSADTLLFKHDIYSYRLILIDTLNKSKIYYKGFINSSEPVFDRESNPATSSITLPDGTIYVTTPTIITPRIWYAISSFYRFMVSGIGTLVIDGRDLRGSVFGNLGVYQSVVLDEQRWIPDLAGMTAFRINQVSGTNVIRYLP